MDADEINDLMISKWRGGINIPLKVRLNYLGVRSKKISGIFFRIACALNSLGVRAL
jgi:hypothetical protein